MCSCTLRFAPYSHGGLQEAHPSASKTSTQPLLTLSLNRAHPQIHGVTFHGRVPKFFGDMSSEIFGEEFQNFERAVRVWVSALRRRQPRPGTTEIETRPGPPRALGNL